MIDERGLRVRAVVTSGAAALVLSYVLLRLVSDQGRSLPQNSWFTVVVVLAAGGAIIAAALPIRRYVQGAVKEPPNPQGARLVLVASRACAIAGGVACGFYAAEALVRLPNAEIPTQQSALWLALVLTLASVLLAVAGLVAQAWCRIPPEDGDASPEEGTARA